jgi:hypothetical protein
MSEVDRLSTSGTYPALPMAGKRRQRQQDSEAAGSAERRADEREPGGGDAAEPAPGPPRSSTSLIDEYA